MQSAIALFRAHVAALVHGATEPVGHMVSPPAVPTAPPPRQYSLAGQGIGVFRPEGSM